MKAFKIFGIYLIITTFFTNRDLYGQGLVSNPHRFTSENWRLKESCNPCHIYESGTGSEKRFLISYEDDTIFSDSVHISGVSKLCITCHDGIVAAFDYSRDMTELSPVMEGRTHTHPVSVKYPMRKFGKIKLHNPDTTSSGLGGTIAEDMLINGRVECISCHNAHFSMEQVPCENCPPGSDDLQYVTRYSSLLKVNKRSALCLTCHNL